MVAVRTPQCGHTFWGTKVHICLKSLEKREKNFEKVQRAGSLEETLAVEKDQAHNQNSDYVSFMEFLKENPSSLDDTSINRSPS